MPPVESPAATETDTATAPPQPDMAGLLDDSAAASAPPGATPPADAELGEAGQRAIAAERQARKDEEKRRKAVERERDALLAAQETEQDKLKREAAEGTAKSEAATAKLRKANLVSALNELGLPKVKAAAKLLDGLEYDDDDEPTNLEERIEAAKAEYGPEVFAVGATPPTPPEDEEPPPGGPTLPETHAGVRPPNDQATEDAQFNEYMTRYFPQVQQPAETP